MKQTAQEPLDPVVWKAAIVVMFGGFMAQLDATVANVSLSSLATQLHSTLSTIQWVTSGYLLALTLSLPLSGWLVDRRGAKAVYLWCFGGFTLTSAACGLAWSAPSLIVFRVLQGLCGGLLAPMAQLMLARVAGPHMTRVAGYTSAPVLLAPILGPVVAGLILQHTSWRWLFLLNLPVGLIGAYAAIVLLPHDRPEGKGRELDWLGVLSLSPALAIFLYGTDHLQSMLGLTALVLAAVLLGAFLRHAQRKGEHALIDLALFNKPIFSTAAVCQFLSNGAMFAGQMLVPLYLIRAAGRSPGEMGWLLAPLGLGMLCTYPSLGWLSKHLGIRKLSVFGALLTTLATLPFAWMAAGHYQPVLMMLALFLRGVGQGSVGIPSISAAYASVEKPRLPMASTTLNIVQRLGGPTLTTLCAVFLGWRLAAVPMQPSLSNAWALSFVLLAGLHAITAIVALRLPRTLDAVQRG